jgi:diguanylate cyclase (GGDEF)-like protein
MTVRGAGDTMVSLTGSIYRDADRILVVAGYDMNEFETLAQSLLDLNNRVNVAYRELARTNRKLEISEQEVRQLSLTDALTGLGNRRRLDEALVMEVDRSARYQAALSLIILDIDHFKRVNDTWGHETGDRILKETGGLLRNMARRTDIATRMGGEELVVLLPETDLEAALLCAERFRAALENRDWGLPAPVTSSFGVACLQPGESGASLLARADAALYAAKQAGRNRVAAAEPFNT